MKSRERALCSALLSEPDKVPLFELLITPQVAKAVLGREPLYWNPQIYLNIIAEEKSLDKIEEKFAEDAIDLSHRKLHHDLFMNGRLCFLKKPKLSL